MKGFVSDPQQALMAALISALSGTPVKPGSFPPRPPKAPPLDFGGSRKQRVNKVPFLMVINSNLILECS